MTLVEFQKDPIMRSLLREGFLYPKLTKYIEMFMYYESKLLSGKKSEAITWTADVFGVSETTIYVVIKKISTLKEDILNG